MFVNWQLKALTCAPFITLTLLLVILLSAPLLFHLSLTSGRDYFSYQAAVAQTFVSSAAPTPAQNPTGNGTNQGDMLVYQNTTYGIRMQYPPGWEVAQFNNSAAAPTKFVVGFISPTGLQRATDRMPENVLVAIENLSSRNIGLAPYTTLQLSLLQEGTQGFDLVESLPATVANNPAHQIIYTETVEQFKLKKMQVWTVKNGLAYLIIYAAEESAYPGQLPTVRKMLDSFEIMSSSPQIANSTR